MDIKISEKEYRELQKSASKLNSLENGGVDNWAYYDEALKDFRREEEFNDNVNDFVSDILETCSEFAYEPSERGAGFAVSEDGGFSLETLVRRTVEKFKEIEK